MEKLSVVIPCYGSEKTIASVVDRLVKEIETDGRYEYEIILVNDSSPDNVFQVIEQKAQENVHIKGLDLARNFGQHAALMAGYTYCDGEIIVSMDDDGQTPPEEIFKLVDKLKNDTLDVVYALYPEVKQSWFRRLGSSINKYMMEKLLNKPKDIVSNSYFACHRFIVEEMLRYKNPFPYLAGLVFRTTNNIGSVVIHQKERVSGESGYNLAKLASLWFNGFTAFSVKPLRIASFLGCFTAFIGFCFLIYTVVNKLVSPSVPMGYSSTMAALLFIGGCIMLMLGLIGEYIGRSYISLNDAPQYVVRSALNLDDECKKLENK